MENNIIKHPGELLLSEITKRGMKQKELAIRTGMSEKHISTIINGSKDISASFARKLDIALGDESGVWAKHQADYDQYMVALEEENNIESEEFSILKRLKDIVDYLLKIGVIHNHCGDTEKIIQLRKVLCVNNLKVIPQITYNAAYRAQVKSSTNIDPYILFAWQRMCELMVDTDVVNPPYSIEKLRNHIPDIKKQMFEHNPNTMIVNLKAIFAECGIAFEVVHHFRGAPVQGFIKLTDTGKNILCLTIRGKKADKFWFSLFHEIGHLLNNDQAVRFVDFDSVKSSMEDKADAFARDSLIDPVLYKEFISLGGYDSIIKIKAFAKKVNVPYWIIIGRLHNDEWLDWSYFANDIPSFEWAE